MKEIYFGLPVLFLNLCRYTPSVCVRRFCIHGGAKNVPQFAAHRPSNLGM